MTTGSTFNTLPSEETLKLSGNMREILIERGNRYGSFSNHAEITQSLKQTFHTLSPKAKDFTPAMSEAIDMIFHKLGRIGNGDPFYADSWVDIAGYAQLVVDILKENEDVPF